MIGVNWRHQYDQKRDELEGKKASTDFTGVESLTNQSFTDEVNLNTVVRRMGVKDYEEIPFAVPDPNFYGDLSEVPDLRTMLDRVRDANDRFMALPPELRLRFHNRPDYLHQFVMDPRNADECVRLGLLKRAERPAEPSKAAAPTPVAPPPVQGS